METIWFLLFGVVGPIRAGILDVSIPGFLLYLLAASFAVTLASWLWNPRIAPMRQGGLGNFPVYWALRFAHVALVGGFLFGTVKLLT